MDVDIGGYLERKAEGAVEATKISPNQFVLIMKNFSPKTGKELEASAPIITMKQLEEVRVELAKRASEATAAVEDIDAMIADLLSLDDPLSKAAIE